MDITMKDIKDFPSAQAEEVQNHLKDLDEQGKLLDYFKEQYGDNLGAENSLANYILKHWNEDGKRLYLEYTGVEVCDDKHTVVSIGVKLNEVTYGSRRYFLWKCNKCSHEWVVNVVNRTNSRSNCPACSSNINIFIPDVNDLGTWCNTQGEYGQQLKEEFIGRLEDGTPVTLGEVSKGSIVKVYWKCSNPNCEYEWPATPNSRTNMKSGCPKCAKVKISESNHKRGESLEHWCNQQGAYGQQLKEEFLGELADGTPIKIEEISRGSATKVRWKCKDCGYIWPASVNKRTNEKFRRGCPKCGHKKQVETAHLQGETLEHWCNRHETYGAKLKSEFIGLDKDNQPIKISEVSMGSHDTIQWKCNKCHKIWITSPNSRTNHKTGCPHCAAYMFTSFPEQFIYHSLKQIFPNTENRWKDPVKGYEYDIMIPELNICIEYSGVNWHADRLDRDQVKEEHCKNNKINFLQIYAHKGEITDEQGLEADDTYEKNQILYKVDINKTEHIKQLKYIVDFILDTYAPKHSLKEIDFTLAEQQANKVMGKA